jgi:hypothetical protein
VKTKPPQQRAEAKREIAAIGGRQLMSAINGSGKNLLALFQGCKQQEKGFKE